MSSNRHQVMLTESGLLSLLQISDSFFPTGAYTQSYGLETYIQEELVNSRETLAQFLTVYLRESMATSDCLALLLAYQAMGENNWPEIFKLDQILSAQKLARESREASIKTGTRMLRVINQFYSNPFLIELSGLVQEGKVSGHHALIFGLVAKAFGFGQKEAALAFIYNAIAGMVNIAVRLIPLGQNDGQWVLYNLYDAMLETINSSLLLSIEDLGASMPGLEIRSMKHERQYSRLFMS